MHNCMKKTFPRSIAKYLRREKARIRREVFHEEERTGHIKKLYERIERIYGKNKEQKK